MILTSPYSLEYVPKKIISLVPSQTELLHYLELENETIGITKFCIHPQSWFQAKTRIGGTKSLNIEKIKELNPDLIISNSEENVKEEVEFLATMFPVWVTHITDLNSSIKMIDDIGQLTEKQALANMLQSEIKQKFLNLKTVISSIRQPLIRTCYLIWREPIMTIGGDTFINDMLRACGFQNIFEESVRYPVIENEEFKRLDCSLILLSSEPYPFSEKHMAEFQAYFPKAKLLVVDGEMFSWYGSRLLEAPEYFEELVRSLQGCF
ncbi:MAG: helical backbone metal receptor [Ferruginibacter sp.]